MKKSLKILIISISVFLIFAGIISGTTYYFISRQDSEKNINKVNASDSKNIVIGEWNALNFINPKGNKQITNGKTAAIAEIINFLKYDLIGILEINKDGNTNNEQVSYLIQALNSNDNNKKWNYHFSNNSTSSPNTASKQVEQILVLYNENLLKLNNFYEYSNPVDADGLYYVRPPYGVSFIYKNNPKISFATIFDHFDSPGVAAEKTTFTPATPETKSNKAPGQGSYEVHDSWYINDVLNEMADKLKTNNIIFMGDTNIKINNQSKAFNETQLNDNGYLFGFKDEDQYKTSLSTKFGIYSNPYDKIIYKLDKNIFDKGLLKTDTKYLKTVNAINNAFIFNLWEVFNYKIISENYLPKSETETINDIQTKYIRNTISDHAPIGIPLRIK